MQSALITSYKFESDTVQKKEAKIKQKCNQKCIDITSKWTKAALKTESNL